MKHIILAAALAVAIPTVALAQSSIGDAMVSSMVSDALRVPPVDTWTPPASSDDWRYRSSELPNVVTGGPIMYPIPGIPTHPYPYTPDPPLGSRAPYQPRW